MYFLKDMNPFLLNKWVDCYGTVRHQKTAVSTKFACFRNKIAALKRREGEGRIKRFIASAFLSSKKKSPKTDNFYHFTFCQSMNSLWADETTIKTIEKSGNTIVGPSSGREVCNRNSKQYCACATTKKLAQIAKTSRNISKFMRVPQVYFLYIFP